MDDIGHGSIARGDTAEALAFLDELTQKSNKPTRALTPGPRVRNVGGTTGTEVRKSIDSVSGTSATPSRPHTPSVPATTITIAPVSTTSSLSSGGGGWARVWAEVRSGVHGVRRVQSPPKQQNRRRRLQKSKPSIYQMSRLRNGVKLRLDMS